MIHPDYEVIDEEEGRTASISGGSSPSIRDGGLYQKVLRRILAEVWRSTRAT
jgi:hypothetical protein